MAAGNVILLIVGILALYGLYWTIREKNAAGTLGVIALGAFAGYLVQSADGGRLPDLLSPQSSPAQPAVVDRQNFVQDDAPGVERPSSSENADQPRRRYVPGADPADRSASGSPQERRRLPATPVDAPVAADAGGPADAPIHGGVEILVEGSWGTLADATVESAVRAALQQAGWEGLQSGGRKVLRVRGSLEDRGLTLGQVPTAAANLTWSLESASGAVIREGGLMDLQGTGVDDGAARAAALRRAADRLADELVQ